MTFSEKVEIAARFIEAEIRKEGLSNSEIIRKAVAKRAVDMTNLLLAEMATNE